MNKYLLLRDNKQTGPYSADEIKTLGIKPYDLIWVEGRSAAWRYPGEIDEFKSFAPQVEEQPFDRFYKKSTTENKSLRQPAESQLTEEKPRVTAENKPKIIAAEDSGAAKETEQKPKPYPVQPTAENTTPGNTTGGSHKTRENETRRPKYVSVSMPSGVQKTILPAANDEREIKPLLKNPAAESAKKETILPSVQEDSIINQSIKEEKPVALVSPPAEARQKHLARNILQGFAVAAGLVSLVALGILIGIGIGSSKIQDPNPQVQQVASPASADTKDNNTALNVLPPTDSTAQKDTITRQLAAEQKVKAKKAASKPAVINETVPVETTIIPEPVAKAPDETSAAADAKEAARQNIAKLISVKTNDYKVGMFGGIDDVKVTVYNASEYPVDLVVVDVSYIQSNKKSYKTESLHFKDIAANSSLTLDAPKTNKGIKVKTSLTHISSKTLGISENIW